MTDTRCGVGRLKKNAFCQRFATSAWFTALTTLLLLVTVSTYAYLASIQTTLQTVFSLSATDFGIILVLVEVGIIISNLTITYFMAQKSRPRIIAVSSGLAVVFCLIFSVVHFTADYSNKLQTTSGATTADDLISRTLCDNGSATALDLNNTAPSTDNQGQSMQSLIITIVFAIASFINGAAYGPIYALVPTYLDDNATETHGSSKYIAIFMAGLNLGPILGFGLGAIFLNFYITFESTPLTPEDDEWIGAWWLGFVIFGAILLVIVPLLFLFPSKLPNPEGENEVDEKQDSNEQMGQSAGQIIRSKSEESQQDGKIRSMQNFLPTLWRLVTNPLYILECLAACAGVYYVAGWIVFLPKFFEDQFSMTAADASIYAGILPPIAGTPIIIAGGYLCSKYKLTLQQDAAVVFISVFGATLCLIPLFFIGCEQYPTQELPAEFSQCTAGCGCVENDYTAVCLEGVSYKSPCLSGCTGYFTEDEQTVYTGCFCDNNTTMTKGSCQDVGCSAPRIYTALSILSMCFISAGVTSGITILMWSVPKQDKSLAIGMHSALNSLLAWIPSQILYGAVIDSACKVWEYPEGTPENPDFYGYCLEYDNATYKIRYVGMTVGAMLLASLFSGIGWSVSYLPRYRQGEKPEEKPKDQNGLQSEMKEIAT